MSKTENNLKLAFAGESQANRKYLAFAKKADDEGFKQAAKLFRAAADAETVHALAHLKVLGAVKTTKENLESAINGETHEFENMYPEMIEIAESEKNEKAKMSFRLANEVEKIHAGLYKKTLAGLENKTEVDYYVCQICGNTGENSAPDKCQICGAPKKLFKKID